MISDKLVSFNGKAFKLRIEKDILCYPLRIIKISVPQATKLTTQSPKQPEV